MQPLPIDDRRDEILAAAGSGPLVITAATGAGKSTQVPRWCRELGRVLVVEPRRVACRGLAQRVAELEGTALGKRVGYSVRDDHRAGKETEILFATPGMVLQWLAGGALPPFEVFILDEFHERRQDTDLLLALAPGLERKLLVMSATLDGERVARHLGGRHLHAEGRAFPVQVRHLPAGTLLPEPQGLERRLLAAFREAEKEAGDMLVFLPGKGEIALAADLLRPFAGLEVLPLHGGLELREQSRIFRPGRRRRAILATNVAETSITVPRIGVVVDTGLVRQTRYHEGRGYLTLVPIAMDSAAQRSGRAGRLGPGVCLRLWDRAARLAPSTPPEIHREAVTPLVLAAAVCGARAEELPFLDPPEDYALAAAREELARLGALDGEGAVTRRGREIFGLPLDAPLGSLIVEGRRGGLLAETIDLAAALAGGRPLYELPGRGELEGLPEEGCDATLLVRALAGELPPGVNPLPAPLQEARTLRSRLRRAWEVKEGRRGGLDRKRLALTAIAADPHCAYIPRRRRGRTWWSNGGPEAELGRESSIDPDKAQALVALETRAFGQGGMKKRLVITRALAALPGWFAAAGLGAEEMGRVVLEKGSIRVAVRRVYAGMVLREEERSPRGELLRRAVAELFCRGSLFREVLPVSRERLARLALLFQVEEAGLLAAKWRPLLPPRPAGGEHREWVVGRLAELGLEGEEDLGLIEGEDLLPATLPEELERELERDFPLEVRPGGCIYRVDYDFRAKEVLLTPAGDPPREPPSPRLLPRFAGFKVKVKHHSRTWTMP